MYIRPRSPDHILQEGVWHYDEETEVSVLGSEFANAITALAHGELQHILEQRKKKSEPVRKVFWEEKRYNPPIGNTHMCYEYEAYDKEQTKHWKRGGKKFTNEPRLAIHYKDSGPKNPEEFPNCFEKPVKVRGRQRELLPFTVAHQYQKPVERDVIKEEHPGRPLGPLTYHLPDPWEQFSRQPSSGNIIHESSMFKSQTLRESNESIKTTETRRQNMLSPTKRELSKVLHHKLKLSPTNTQKTQHNSATLLHTSSVYSSAGSYGFGGVGEAQLSFMGEEPTIVQAYKSSIVLNQQEQQQQEGGVHVSGGAGAGAGGGGGDLHLSVEDSVWTQQLQQQRQFSLTSSPSSIQRPRTMSSIHLLNNAQTARSRSSASNQRQQHQYNSVYVLDRPHTTSGVATSFSRSVVPKQSAIWAPPAPEDKVTRRVHMKDGTTMIVTCKEKDASHLFDHLPDGSSICSSVWGQSQHTAERDASLQVLPTLSLPPKQHPASASHASDTRNADILLPETTTASSGKNVTEKRPKTSPAVLTASGAPAVKNIERVIKTPKLMPKNTKDIRVRAKSSIKNNFLDLDEELKEERQANEQREREKAAERAARKQKPDMALKLMQSYSLSSTESLRQQSQQLSPSGKLRFADGTAGGGTATAGAGKAAAAAAGGAPGNAIRGGVLLADDASYTSHTLSEKSIEREHNSYAKSVISKWEPPVAYSKSSSVSAKDTQILESDYHLLANVVPVDKIRIVSNLRASRGDNSFVISEARSAASRPKTTGGQMGSFSRSSGSGAVGTGGGQQQMQHANSSSFLPHRAISGGIAYDDSVMNSSVEGDGSSAGNSVSRRLSDGRYALEATMRSLSVLEAITGKM